MQRMPRWPLPAERTGQSEPVKAATQVPAPSRKTCKQDRGFRLAQISDCHLSSNPDTPYRGLKADSGLAAVVQAVANWRADAVMLSGDLSEDASEPSYRRLAKHIHSLNIPVFALPGNHDLPELMQQYFPHGAYQGPWLQTAGAWKLMLFNSARPRRIDGCIAATDLQQLDDWLKNDGAGPALLALHHQPVPVGAPWIDKHMLDQPEDFLQCVARHPQIKAVVWGHVHQVYEAERQQTRFMSAPSSAANSLRGTDRFSLDPAGPACRWLELFDDGRLESGILYGMSASPAMAIPAITTGKR